MNNFHTTHSKENKELTEHFFNSAYEKGDIYTKEIEQLFDEQKNIFLSRVNSMQKKPRIN